MSEFAQQQIAAADGRTIIARFFGSIDRPKASVLIVPAMGVAQHYYAPFAAWLARQGFLAVTFDYRGIGLSRAGRLRGFDADIFDWARLDCTAMVETLTARVSGKPLYWIGHSLGGQIIPFVPNWKPSGADHYDRRRKRVLAPERAAGAALGTAALVRRGSAFGAVVRLFPR